MNILKTKTLLIIIFITISSIIFPSLSFLKFGNTEVKASNNIPTSREIAKWPYSKYSVWNMPVGQNAQYVDAQINADFHLRDALLYSDEDFQLLNKNDPVVNLRRFSVNPGDAPNFWTNPYDKWTHRCDAQGPIFTQIHVPYNLQWVGSGNTPNASAGILMANSYNVWETQPFARCEAGGEAYSQWPSFPNDLSTHVLDIRGDGIGYGGHGGSGLAASAGNILPSDFAPGLPIDSIRHALKILLPETLIAPTGSTTFESYRWPATRGDCCTTYSGNVNDLTMGSLLALPQNFDENSLRSEFGRRVAWTLKNYGAYLVDSTGWNASVLQLATDGSVNDVQALFKSQWGFDFGGNSGNNDWLTDYKDMMNAINVVSNNTPSSIGGGGNPRQCLAPDFSSGDIDLITNNPNGNVTEPVNCSPIDFSTLNLKLFLEGALINENGTYNTVMRNEITQYNNSLNNNYVDIINLEIKNDTGTVVKNIELYIDQDGNAIDKTSLTNNLIIDNVPFPANYKFNIYHRNHIGVGINGNINLDGNLTQIDLTTSNNTIFSNMKLLPNGKYALHMGNVDNNKSVRNAGDRAFIVNAPSSVFAYSDLDVNMNGVVNSTDRNLVVNGSTLASYLN